MANRKSPKKNKILVPNKSHNRPTPPTEAPLSIFRKALNKLTIKTTAISSTTAAPNVTDPSAVSSRLYSFNTCTEILTDVALNITPIKIASFQVISNK